MSAPRTFTTYEHRVVRLGDVDPATGATFTRRHYAAFVQLNDRHGSRYADVLAAGLRLNAWVGVVQLPGLTLEILPKTEAAAAPETWRRVLLEMLRVAGHMPTAAPVARLAVRPLRLLDVYVRLLLGHCETLRREGLVKSYRTTDGNRPALKGRLLFGEHLRRNLVHQERFYVRHQTYDAATPLNALLRMALTLAADVVPNAGLRTQAQTLLLAWPETPAGAPLVAVPAAVPTLTRRTERYRPALGLALLLLHRLSPDVRAGRTEAVALLFAMPRLFEAFVARALRTAVRAAGSEVAVETQASQAFWDDTVPIRPDVVVRLPATISHPTRTIVLDTKWKAPVNHRPSASDLQQLYAYCHLWRAHEGWLLYPATGRTAHGGAFADSKFLAEAGADKLTGHVRFAEVVRDGALNPNFGRELLADLTSGHFGSAPATRAAGSL